MKAAIEKNKPFCATLESMWANMLKYGNRWVCLEPVRDRIAGAALWVKLGSREEEELIFLRDLLTDQRDVYETKWEAA